MRVRLALMTVPALAVVAVDLAVKHYVVVDAAAFHRRSDAWALTSLILIVVVVALVVLPSRLVAFAGGVVAGGVAGNFVSALVHGGSVPNPLVVGDVAFTVADVCVLCGVPLLVVALVRVAIAHRSRIDRAIPPRRWELGLRRRLGL